MLPSIHVAFWDHVICSLKASIGDVVVAGSAAAAQMQYNIYGRNFEFNDIDFWYDDCGEKVLTLNDMDKMACKSLIYLMVDDECVVFSSVNSSFWHDQPVLYCDCDAVH